MSKKHPKKRGKNATAEDLDTSYGTPIDDIEKNIKQNQVDQKHHNFKITHNFKFSSKQVALFKTMLNPDTKMVFIDGPAGSAKTYISAYAGLQLLKDQTIDQIIYIRTAVESASKSLGFLPGELSDKFQQYLVPLNEKLEELLEPQVVKALNANNVIEAVPVNFARGRTFKNCVVIIDECQNLTSEEVKTILTRFGINCKMFVIGDTQQADIGAKSGFGRVVAQFDHDKCKDRGFHSFKLDSSDIVRSPDLAFIIDMLNSNPLHHY